MINRYHIPYSLAIIAIPNILLGLSSLIETLGSFMTNHVKINLGIVELFIGIVQVFKYHVSILKNNLFA